MKPRDPKPPTSPAPPVVWPTDEGRNTFVLTNQTAWQRHTEAARGYREYVERLGVEIAAKGQDLEKLRQELETLRQEIDARIQEQRQQDHYARQEQGAADAYAAALTALGEQLPPLQDRLVAAAPGMSPVEAAAHAAAWNDMAPTGFHQTLPATPQGDPQDHAATFGGASFAETQQDGFCINCRQHVWRVPVSDLNPKGARHSFSATCNPDDPNSTYADLGENREAAS